MLDLVPLAGARRESGRRSRSVPSSSAKLLQRLLPESIAAAVAAAAIGGDQAVRSRVENGAEPISFHQRRMLAQANWAVSWSIPTLTQPSLQARS